MKIRLKVKHLVFGIAAVLLFIPLMSLVIAPQVNLYMLEKRLAKGDEAAKDDLLQMLEEGHLLASQEWGLIEDYMIEGDRFYRFDVYVGPAFSQVDDRDDVSFSWPEKRPYIEKYVQEGPVNDYYAKAAKDLMMYFEELGDWSNADDVLVKAAERLKDDMYRFDKQDLLLERVRLALRFNKLQEANLYVQNVIATLNEDDAFIRGEVGELKARIILREGRVEEAYQDIQKQLTAYEKQFRQQKADKTETYTDDQAHYDMLQLIAIRLIEVRQSNTDASNVEGKVVRSNGEPVQRVGVFLRKEHDVNRSIGEDEPYQIVTDEQGRFNFQGVVPGNYQIFLGLKFDQIDGWVYPIDMYDWITIDGSEDITHDITLQKLFDVKSPINGERITGDTIQFSWEAVDDAAYYNISMDVPIDSGSIGRSIKTHIKGTELSLPIEELYAQRGNILIGDEETVDGSVILGVANPNIRLSWRVEAFDDDGKLITRTNGYRLNDDTMGNLPSFRLQERQLTDADRLLIDDKIEAALSAYMDNYDHNPDDLHSLRMIYSLIGTKGDGTFETRNELAYPYTQALVEKEEGASALPYISDLVGYHYNREEWSDVVHWFHFYRELNNNDREGFDYVQGKYGHAQMMQGKLSEAREAFEKSQEPEYGNRFVGKWLALELYLGTSFSDVVQLARQHPEPPDSYGKHEDWEKMLIGMEDEAREDDHYRETLQKGIQQYIEGGEQALNHWLSEVKDKPAMKQFLKAVKGD